MLFTWDWKNTCVVFQWWHIKTYSHFLVSFVAIAALAASYEYLKEVIDRWEINVLQSSRIKVKRSLLYGVQVFFSFWLMLVFMTYNGWLMIAVALGASIGNYFWGKSASRSLACH